MREANVSPLNCTLHIESPDEDTADSTWQGECRQLYQRMLGALEDGELKPVQQHTAAGAKTDVVELFSQIIAYGISIKAFSAIYQVAKLWLEHRPRCDVVLKFPDGSEIKVQKVAWDEAERLMLEHQHRDAQGQ